MQQSTIPPDDEAMSNWEMLLDTRVTPAIQSDITTPGSDRSDEVTVIGSPGGSEKSPLHGKSTTAQVANRWDAQPPERVQPTSWRPFWVRAGPISGLSALLFCVLQVLASYLILACSDGQPISGWKFQPSVYLAILTAISNKALAFAVVQGTVVTFWLDALRGTTIGQLHNDWAYGLHVYKAIVSGRHFNLLALACICATLVAIDGPLLQRSSTWKLATITSQTTLSLSIAPELPSYSTGLTHPPNTNYLDLRDSLNPVVRDYGHGAPIKLPNAAGCGGTCSTVVRAPTLAVMSCTSELRYFDYATPLTKEQQDYYNRTAIPPANRAVFNIGVSLILGPREMIELNTTVVQKPKDGSCAAYANATSCLLGSASGEYAVQVKDGAIRLMNSRPSNVVEANNTAITNSTIIRHQLADDAGEWTKTTLSGIAAVARMQFGSAVSLIQWSGVSAPQVAAYSSGWFAWQQGVEDTIVGCIPDIADPTEQIFNQVNELMFRVGVAWKLTLPMDDGMKVNQTVLATDVESVEVFRTEFAYFAAAAAVQLFTSLVIGMTFWGYWRLGRATSLSPLETAKAFNAAALRDAGSNCNGREIANLLGDRNIQYGVLIDEVEHTVTADYSPTEKLGFATGARVNRPTARHPSWRGCIGMLRATYKTKGRRRRAVDRHLIVESDMTRRSTTA